MSRRWIAACLVLLLTPAALERLQLTSSSETSARAAVQLTAAKPDASRFTAVDVIAPGELDEPMTFAIADDGRVFINERRTGDIKMYDPATGTTVRVGTIPVNHQYTSAAGAPREAEEGFVGLTIDPAFETNGWAYILYADPDVAKHTLARIEIRELLKELRRMGKTIIISSHILHELSELCNTVGIVEQGELLFSGSVSEIMTKASMGVVVHIVVDERMEQAAELLAKVNGITKVDVNQSNGTPRIDVTIDPDSGLMVSELPNRLIAQGFRLSSMQEEQVNLETAFMRLTKGLVQ